MAEAEVRYIGEKDEQGRERIATAVWDKYSNHWKTKVVHPAGEAFKGVCYEADPALHLAAALNETRNKFRLEASHNDVKPLDVRNFGGQNMGPGGTT